MQLLRWNNPGERHQTASSLVRGAGCRGPTPRLRRREKNVLDMPLYRSGVYTNTRQLGASAFSMVSPKNIHKIVRTRVARNNNRRLLSRKNCRCSCQILNWLNGPRADLRSAHTEMEYCSLSGRRWLT